MASAATNSSPPTAETKQADGSVRPAIKASRAEPERPSAVKSPWYARIAPKALREREALLRALEHAVENSKSPTVDDSSLAPATQNLWLSDLFEADILDKWFTDEHMGNYVIMRQTKEKIFEIMPVYTRIGMHLLFHGPLQIRLLHLSRVRNLLKNLSIRQGAIYDAEDPKIVVPHIESFIKTYSIDMKEVLEPDIKKYRTFNDFFARRLKPGARPPASPENPSIINSCADCRLTVFPNFELSQKLWVKGRDFSVKSLLKDPALEKRIGPSSAIAIFRLAPQDYHRYHSPVTGTIGSIKHIPGEYYTVNPQAVNERLDVFTANSRSILTIESKLTAAEDTPTIPVALVAVGALLVGSIEWDTDTPGAVLQKGGPAGAFKYGGSTVIVLFPSTAGILWDADLINNTSNGLETVVKAGERIGQASPQSAAKA